MLAAGVVVAALACGGCGAAHHGSARSGVASTASNDSSTWGQLITAANRVPPRVAPPPIVQRPIPFGAPRKAEMEAYAQRHYGFASYRLDNPHVIVEHYTETATFGEAYNTFVADVPDSELRELPGTCAHFIVDRDGTIYQLVPLPLMCRHTVGLNWTAIGIEHVGMSDQDILGNPAQLEASLRLTHWLACKFGITTANVIGHNESLSSPYHRELVPALRQQTHEDWTHADMTTYRGKLTQQGGC